MGISRRLCVACDDCGIEDDYDLSYLCDFGISIPEFLLSLDWYSDPEGSGAVYCAECASRKGLIEETS